MGNFKVPAAPTPADAKIPAAAKTAQTAYTKATPDASIFYCQWIHRDQATYAMSPHWRPATAKKKPAAKHKLSRSHEPLNHIWSSLLASESLVIKQNQVTNSTMVEDPHAIAGEY